MAIEVGAKVSGKVSGITNFGAFVDLDDNKTGLVHISQISDKYIKDIHDVLSVGDTVTVKVMRIGDDGKIALSMKAAAPHEHSEGHGHGRFNHRGEGHHYRHERNNNYHGHHDNYRGGFGGNNRHHNNHQHENFDEMLAGYMKESESRLSTLKRQTDGKRGGRGGRRS
ncbi:S1 domain-containing RNA-binding protein [Limosilactobacillus sp.]|jgi:S1 RNA binding domain protein|uniref:S1 domain-containing RNA-binding protein n=1 Tax=Limosilactobacillus sp. TaxID=2773925 RepID=UPI0035A1BFD6